jgi:dolichol-phosphate mannosyltransferase
MKLISVVIPVFNEELNIKPFYDRMIRVINQLSTKFRFEIIFTDNHSSDNTFCLLKDLSKLDRRVKVIRFSRNFGYQKSILTGYLQSKGDATFQIDCDLQDPPELLVDFIEKWQSGFDVVYGIRISRAEGFFITIMRKSFYRLINYLSDIDLPNDAGDFRLVDKRVIDVMRECDDASPYIRGLIASLGFRQTGIPYARSKRSNGTSKFNFFALMSLAFDGILNHSIIPLRVASIIGILMSIVTLLASFFYLITKFFFEVQWPAGFTTLTLLQLIGITINALFLGVIGEYLGRIYLQVKKRPMTIIDSAVNVSPDNTWGGG